MIFSILSDVPCLVLENKTQKIKGTYEIIDGINGVKLYKKGTVETDIKELLKIQKNNYSSTKFAMNYLELIKLLKRII